MKTHNHDLFPETTGPDNQSGVVPRAHALTLLLEVLDKKQALDMALERFKPLYDLEPRDRAFTRLLVATTLRRLGQIDAVLEKMLDNPTALGSSPVRGILRLGVAQLVFLKTPPHAAVNACVELADKGQNMKRYKSLINAVLRRVSRDGEAILAQTTLRDNLPEWLYHTWVDDWGVDAANQIVEAHLSEAPTDITVKHDGEAWAERLNGVVLPTGNVRLQAAGNITKLAGFDDGVWWVQDMAASLPVYMLGDISGKKIIDVCAAPGGKTAQLVNAGAVVTAVDRSAQRMKLLDENMKRLGFEVQTVIADASAWQPAAPVDAVVVDAPCSATGTMRRHPDLAHLRDERDIARLVDVQRRILSNAAKMVKAGGMMMYCTCSLQRAESEDQADWFLENHPDFSRVPLTIDEVDGHVELVGDKGYFRALPFHLADWGGIDGFFAARFVKR